MPPNSKCIFVDFSPLLALMGERNAEAAATRHTRTRTAANMVESEEKYEGSAATIGRLSAQTPAGQSPDPQFCLKI
jgi:hypothetical protein